MQIHLTLIITRSFSVNNILETIKGSITTSRFLKFLLECNALDIGFLSNKYTSGHIYPLNRFTFFFFFMYLDDLLTL